MEVQTDDYMRRTTFTSPPSFSLSFGEGWGEVGLGEAKLDTL